MARLLIGTACASNPHPLAPSPGGRGGTLMNVNTVGCAVRTVKAPVGRTLAHIP
jgi:hypothetical protein